ncbi:TetR/AcrR family transcriptional regulator [Nonomuraea aurantiaca]|jgi:AcrR family transcriptional regulator|uniref:TetR/AcrR family transcriptional regulator n=1 Tax=Nonomuraea aurantiaca TaxID=2878562 RepID=UPI001CD92483|nr:TetR/AcrR family transcriptional regulator [Nonomuraea aurantiaca]MCA2224999.1 TetR/AcrR family transcriptional regulator [Nonomuraea aurantiaca]
MDEGLRERKKRETRQRIADVAMGLFMIHGFDNVTVAQVARAADVSVNTVFNYFGTKEDLFADRQDEVVDLSSKVVRERRPGESIVAAFRRDFFDALDTREWRYGMGEGAEVFGRMVEESAALIAKMREVEHISATNLAAVIAEETGAGPDDLTPQLVADQILGTTRLLTRHALRRKMAGEQWPEIWADVRTQAARAFDLLETGIGGYGRRSLVVEPAEDGGAAEDHQHDRVEADHR